MNDTQTRVLRLPDSNAWPRSPRRPPGPRRLSRPRIGGTGGGKIFSTGRFSPFNLCAMKPDRLKLPPPTHG